MRKGQVVEVELYGQPQKVQYLGRGQFATAYLQTNGKVLLFVEGCWMKDALCNLNDVPYFPATQRLEVIENPNPKKTDDIYVYEMDYSEPIRAKKHPEAWAIIKELQRARELAIKQVMGEHNQKYSAKRVNQAADIRFLGVESIFRTIEIANVPEDIKESLTELANELCNWNEGCVVEFQPKNIGIDDQGKISFRDICFDTHNLRRYQ